MDKKELMSCLKDAYELEKQLYTLNQLKEEYETLYKVLGERTKTPLSKNEKFDKTLDKADYAFDSNYEFSHMPPIDSFDKFKRIKDLANIHTFFDIKDVEEYFRESWKNTPEYKKLMTAYKKEYKHNVKAVHWSGLGLFLFILAFILTYILTKQFIISLIISVIVVCIYNKFIDWNMDAYYALRSYAQKCYANAIDDRRTWCEEKRHIISIQCKEIILEDIAQTKKTLEKVYSNNFIHRKYRNLIAVGQIYEYLDTNRCEKLEGANGAYNLFESELRQNIIILKLDEIIEQLDELQSTMYYVASAIDEGNRILNNVTSQLGQISSSLSAIESNTALTSYNTQCTAFNTDLMRRYN